jgi:hypothetical protein
MSKDPNVLQLLQTFERVVGVTGLPKEMDLRQRIEQSLEDLKHGHPFPPPLPTGNVSMPSFEHPLSFMQRTFANNTAIRLNDQHGVPSTNSGIPQAVRTKMKVDEEMAAAIERMKSQTQEYCEKFVTGKKGQDASPAAAPGGNFPAGGPRPPAMSNADQDSLRCISLLRQHFAASDQLNDQLNQLEDASSPENKKQRLMMLVRQILVMESLVKTNKKDTQGKEPDHPPIARPAIPTPVDVRKPLLNVAGAARSGPPIGLGAFPGASQGFQSVPHQLGGSFPGNGPPRLSGPKPENPALQGIGLPGGDNQNLIDLLSILTKRD